MTFQIGTLVKWADRSPTRFGFAASDIGKVVGVHNFPKGCEIDVEFDDGGVVHRAIGDWFEPALMPVMFAEEDAEDRRLPLVA
jgi:hypothetical protein